MRSTERGPSTGRIRLGVLLATVGALLLIPTAQAFAAPMATVNIEGTGSGEVTGYELNPGTPPLACSYETPGPATGVCETEMGGEEGNYWAGAVANAAPGSEFVGWVVEENGGALAEYCEFEGGKGFKLTGGENFELIGYLCPLGTESENGTAKATAFFECETEGGCGEEVTEEFSLTVSKVGTGSGTVTSSPAGINCGGTCSAEFEEGEEVTLSASPASGSEFSGWSGSGCSGTGTCIVTMSEAKEVTATFDEEEEPEPEEFALEISTDGTGSGEVECEVESGPAEPCEAQYEEGTEVALVPEAETGSEFVKWSEDCTGSGACELTMDEAHSVTATFDEEEEPEPEEFDLTIVKAGTGSGSVTCNAGACAPTYEEGEEVTLAASAASGSTFTGWSGAGCSGTGTCKVTIDADTTVTATFTANAKEEPKKEEPKPTPTPEGKAKAAATASVKSGKASLKLTCTGGPCKGQVQLTAKVKQGKKAKSLVIGKASFSLSDGATATIKVKLSGPAKQELAKGKTLKAKTAGSGITASTVKLKQAKKS